MNISQTKFLKPLSVHEYTPQLQTYCERKKIHGTVPLICIFGPDIEDLYSAKCWSHFFIANIILQPLSPNYGAKGKD